MHHPPLRSRNSAPARQGGRPLAVTLLAALAASGCGGVTEPLASGDVAGRYVLTRVGGQPLPHPTRALTGPEGPVFLFASEYVLSSDGTYTSFDVMGPPSIPRDTTRDANRWRFVSGAGADTVYLTFGHTSRTRYEYGYAVLRRGRMLRADRYYDGLPRPAEEYERR
jgi:hypothetical protein